jgi:hypothetical protein
MKELVGFMNGDFTDCLITSNTHLVVNSILSDKYFVSTENPASLLLFLCTTKINIDHSFCRKLAKKVFK